MNKRASLIFALGSAALVVAIIWLPKRATPKTLLESVQSGERIMFVGAHPDDELTVGAFLARAAETTDVLVVSLTRGEGGRNRSGVELGDSIGEVRSEELRRSCERLGAELRILDFANGASPEIKAKIRQRELPRETPEAVIARWETSGRDPLEELHAVIQEWKPKIVVSFESVQGFSNHPEHRAAAILAKRVVKESPQIDRLYAVFNRYPGLRNSRIPVLDSSLSSEVIDGRDISPLRQKRYVDIAFKALAEHVSQFGGEFMTSQKRTLYQRELEQQAFIRIRP